MTVICLVERKKLVRASLLDYIVCPLCAGTFCLEAKRATDGEIVSGRLVCRSRKHHAYSIRSGVPELLNGGPWSKDKKRTERSFSAKWRKARDYRSKTGNFYTAWYLQRYGFKDLRSLRSFLAGKRFILDAGTGTGRDSNLYTENSSAQVFGIDISEGIHIAYRDLRGTNNLHLLRADLTELPFAAGFFDFIACDQVLHHTPDPKESLHRLLRCLAKGGHILFYVYRKKGPIREFSDDYLRQATTEMSEEDCYRFAQTMTRFGRALSDLRVKIRVPEDIPNLDLKAGSYDLQRFFHWNVFKCFWNDSFDYNSNVIINFDWYHPKHAHRYTEKEIRGWCRDAGLRIVHFDVIESGISVLAVKG